MIFIRVMKNSDILLESTSAMHVAILITRHYSFVNRFDILHWPKFPNIERGRPIVADVSSGARH